MADAPHLTIRCEYPDQSSSPTEVTFGLSLSYGMHDAHEAHDWFIDMMREREEFEVMTNKPGEWPLSFCSDTVRRVMVE